MKTYDISWLKKHAHFNCSDMYCASENSFKYSELRVSPNGKCYCRECWEMDKSPIEPEWDSLKEFYPFEGLTYEK